ncbi:MAG: hypothetical protein IPL06_15370 [Betaproteobacteria bacterium]|nr:hypothetical protein [Betaproteobacteria bacterium]
MPDLVVEDATVDSKLFTREADLQRHLESDAEKAAASAQQRPMATRPRKSPLRKPADQARRQAEADSQCRRQERRQGNPPPRRKTYSSSRR